MRFFMRLATPVARPDRRVQPLSQWGTIGLNIEHKGQS
jgi:hypothetical protein